MVLPDHLQCIWSRRQPVQDRSYRSGVAAPRKQSELKEKTDEILRLTETVRRLAYALESDKEKGQYVPDFKQYGGGAAGRKEGKESSRG